MDTEAVVFDDSLNAVFPPRKGGKTIAPLKTRQSSWFDIRVFYVRVSPCSSEDAPDALTMYYFPESFNTFIEMNGGRIFRNRASRLILRRDRIDRESAEVTYVSTDNLRISSKMSFKIFDKDDPLICGNLERSLESKVDSLLESESEPSWTMECACVMGSSKCCFTRNRPMFSALSCPPPSVEVYLAGQVSRSPVVLTETVKLIGRRKYLRHEILDTITEDDREQFTNSPVADELAKDSERPEALLYTGPAMEWVGFKDVCEYNERGIFCLENDEFCRSYDDPYLDGEEGQLSWFKAGIRVGLGIGLGICLGLGLGVGVLVRTYQSTAKTFNGRILTRRKFL